MYLDIPTRHLYHKFDKHETQIFISPIKILNKNSEYKIQNFDFIKQI